MSRASPSIDGEAPHLGRVTGLSNHSRRLTNTRPDKLPDHRSQRRIALDTDCLTHCRDSARLDRRPLDEQPPAGTYAGRRFSLNPEVGDAICSMAVAPGCCLAHPEMGRPVDQSVCGAKR